MMTGLARPEWSLLFLLPNVDLSNFEPYEEPALTLYLHDIAVVDCSDERVVDVRRWSSAADALLRAFHDEYGRPIVPAALIARRAWLKRIGKDPTPIVAFRNAVAMAHVLGTRAVVGDAAARGIFWADAMDLHPAHLSVDGERVDIGTPALQHLHVPTGKLHLARDPGLPRVRPGMFDVDLARALGRAWHARFVRHRGIRRWDVLFRSLEIAYHAAAIRFKNYGSIHEAGLSAALWVSAAEILAAPAAGKRNVTWGHVLDLLQAANWVDPRLRAPVTRWPRRRQEKMIKGRRKKYVKEWRAVDTAQLAYMYLYEARSKFLHGDRISKRLLLPFHAAPRLPLLSVAATVYRTALIAFLQANLPKRGPEIDRWAALGFFAQNKYEQQLLRTQGHLFGDEE